MVSVPRGPESGPGHFKGFDGLRALAVIAVVWHHTHPGFDAIEASRRGFLGVDVFFVLSGFLITALLLRERSQRGRISLRDFYARRSLRIFPLYYAVLAILSLLYLTVRAGSDGSAAFMRDLPYLLTYTSNWVETHSIMQLAWSLATEEQFYLLWPPLLVLLGRHSLSFLLAFLALNQLVNFGLLDEPLAAAGMAYESLEILQCTFTPIVLGVFAAFIAADARIREVLAAAPWSMIGAVACVTLVIAASVPGTLRGVPRLSFQFGAAVVLLSIVFHQGMTLTRLLEFAPLAWIGKVSYGVYLLHLICADVATRALGRAGLGEPLALFAVTLVLTLLAAGASYRFFERPLLRLKDRFR